MLCRHLAHELLGLRIAEFLVRNRMVQEISFEEFGIVAPASIIPKVDIVDLLIDSTQRVPPAALAAGTCITWLYGLAKPR